MTDLTTLIQDMIVGAAFTALIALASVFGTIGVRYLAGIEEKLGDVQKEVSDVKVEVAGIAGEMRVLNNTMLKRIDDVDKSVSDNGEKLDKHLEGPRRAR